MEMNSAREALKGSVVVAKKTVADSSDRADVETPVELGALPVATVSAVSQDSVVIAAAEKKLAAKELEIDKQKKQLIEAVRQIKVLRENVKVKEVELVAITKQLRETEAVRDEVRSAKVKELAEAAAILKQTREEAERSSAAASEQLAVRDSRISSLESELHSTVERDAAALKAEKAEAAKQARIATERLAAREKELTAAIDALRQEKEALVAKLNEATTELERREKIMAEQEDELDKASASLAEARERSTQLSREKAEQQEVFRTELGQAVVKYQEMVVAFKAKCEEAARYEGALAKFAASPQRPSAKSRLSASAVAEEDLLNVSRILDLGTEAAVDSSTVPATPTRPALTKM
jgi:chromosome segregation ATPase